MVEHHLDKVRVRGSFPRWGTKFRIATANLIKLFFIRKSKKMLSCFIVGV